MNPKVSIITPCYNGEKFIEQYFDSIVQQDYDRIELILVNDGSNDHSEELILQQSKRLDPKRVSFRYIKKENGGQPSAINAGLQIFTGDYITWPDIDDRMHPDYLSEKVRELEMHPEIGLLVSKSAVIQFSKPETVLRYTWTEWKGQEDALNRMIDDVGFYYEPGSYMARSSAFLTLNSRRHIYDDCGKWSGPQIQLIFPFLAFGVVGYLDECLYDYYLHGNNDHQKYTSAEERLVKFREIEKLYEEVIGKSGVANAQNYMHRIRIQVAWKYYRAASRQWAPVLAREGSKLLKQEGEYTFKKKIHTELLCHQLSWQVLQKLKKLRKK